MDFRGTRKKGLGAGKNNYMITIKPLCLKKSSQGSCAGTQEGSIHWWNLLLFTQAVFKVERASESKETLCSQLFSEWGKSVQLDGGRLRGSDDCWHTCRSSEGRYLHHESPIHRTAN